MSVAQATAAAGQSFPPGAASDGLSDAVRVQAAADGLIAVACIALSVTVIRLVRRRPALVFPRAFVTVALLLAAAGVTHAIALLEVWEPLPWLSGASKLATGLLALAAAVVVMRGLPAILALPSRQELTARAVSLEERVAARTADLTAANQRLRAEDAQRRQAEAEVRRLNAELQARLAELQGLFKLLPVGVAISTDATGRDLQSNRAYDDLFGLQRPAAGSLTRAPFELPATFRILREGRDLGADELPLPRAIAQGAAVRDFEFTVARNDGVVLEVLANAVPVRDDEGNIHGAVATFQDITTHRQSERKRLEFERKLLHAQKLESIGVLAGGIAHDFNNLLTGILGHANFARSELARGSHDIDHLLAQVEVSAQRAAELCRQLLAYAGKGRFVVRLIDANVAVEQAVPLLKLSMSKKITLDLQLGPALPPFRGDPVQINQVLLNLVANASEAIGPNPGTVTVRTERVALTAMEMLTIDPGPEMEPGAFVCIEIKDTGCGIPPEALGHIFEPFFTTKAVGRGLGLAAVLGIVHGHRGGLRVSSQVGVGTTIELFLPVVMAAVRGSTPPAPLATGRRGTVLVVDDEESVRAIARTVLTAAGYAAITASDGEDALTKLREDPMRCEAVLLDLDMPRLDGEDTLMALRMIAPNLPVILTSGHSQESVAQHFVGRGLADFLPKPFVAEALVTAFDHAITRARERVRAAANLGAS